jgi:Na+-driven multidrug efflux pump
VSATPARRGSVDHAAALGTQPVGRLLWQACSQTTLSVSVFGSYALTNAWFIARGVGLEAMAAVNLVAPVLLVLGAISIVVQVTLDAVLIFGLGLGVRGAALATVVGQAVSTAMAMWFFFCQRDRPYRIRLTSLRPHAPTIRALLGVGAPSLLIGFGATLLMVLVNTTLSRTGGATALVSLVAYAVCVRIQIFVAMPQLGISQGLQPVVGYNAGRGLHDRVLRARTLALSATVIYGSFAAVTVGLLAGPLVMVFVDDPGIVATARDALRIVAAGFVVTGVTPLISAYFQSLGRPRPSYLISVGTLLAIKVPLVLALGHTGPAGVWISLVAGELVSALVSLATLRRLRLPDR